MKSYSIRIDIVALWKTGIGSPQPYNTSLVTFLAVHVHRSLRFWIAVLYANIFQLAISGTYLLLNGLVTNMAVCEEWSGFINGRKRLRLSDPRGIQRSSYTLSLPFKFGLPLLIAAALLHWLSSQSIFVIATQDYRYTGVLEAGKTVSNTDYDTTIVGYSPIGIILNCLMGACILAFVIGMGCAEYEGRALGTPGKSGQKMMHMPLASTCSAAISAACHGPAGDREAHLLHVMWGKVDDQWCFSTADQISHSLPPTKQDSDESVNDAGSQGQAENESLMRQGGQERQSAIELSPVQRGEVATQTRPSLS
ncbi:hypothetical protein LTR85_007464 [Meristemomyces frigidus]|nr:hypothetical protein LTR85_007464 [Meristemomyces frigidus]